MTPALLGQFHVHICKEIQLELLTLLRRRSNVACRHNLIDHTVDCYLPWHPAAIAVLCIRFLAQGRPAPAAHCRSTYCAIFAQTGWLLQVTGCAYAHMHVDTLVKGPQSAQVTATGNLGNHDCVLMVLCTGLTGCQELVKASYIGA